MSLLERTIDGASNDSVSTGSLLRNVLILGKRMKSDDLSGWAMKELNGYPRSAIEDLPDYRGPLPVPVEIQASGYFQSSKTYYLSQSDVPDERFGRTQFNVWLAEPLAELERLADAERDPTQEWPSAALGRYLSWCREGKAPHYPDFNPMSARKIITRTMLHGVIDTVRTRALIFALDLQAEFPNAGEPNGPTVDIPKVRESVTINIHNTIYGGTNAIANGETVNQVANIEQGNVESLLAALKSLGVGEVDRQELRDAIEADGGRKGPATTTYIDKLKKGGVMFGSALASAEGIKLMLGLMATFFGLPSL